MAEFDEWYQINKDADLKIGESLPPDVRLWPDSSWKKFIIKYLMEKNKYFVYPRSSYSTNFGDAGVNHRGTKLFQVPLQYGSKIYICQTFMNLSPNMIHFAKYSPESIKNNNSDLLKFNFDVDLYGIKNECHFTDNPICPTQKM